MNFVGALLVFLLVAVGLSWILMKFWVIKKEAYERVTGTGAAQLAAEAIPVSPTAALRQVLERLGKVAPQSPKDANVLQRKLIRAGIRNRQAPTLLSGAKIVLAVVLPAVTSLALLKSGTDGSNKLLIVVGSAVLGFIAPNEYVNMKIRKRQKEIRRGLPNALDLMVVCVESGLGLDQAILQVAKELEHAHPEISEEFAMVNLELKAGKRRVEALRNMAERTSVEDLKKLVAVLIQADRFGTGVAQSLRGHADYMRVQARQIAEEKAAKLGVKLVFPIFFCILPSLFVVTVGPIVVKIMRELMPMMTNF
ncbi:MAG: type II secretion system F family protein [Candidatus Solibacter usitatus]|nr:type II secretion system F family protein [Candidatus Solibacter usitatus]